MNEEKTELIIEMEKHLQDMETLGINTKLHVPHGVMSYARTYRNRISFIKNEILKRNISYLLMLNDLFIWLLNRFKLVSGIKDMLIKSIITNYGFILEGINKTLAKEISKEKEIGFDSASTILCENRIITIAMKKQIRWVYDIRNKQHYDTLNQLEFERYSVKEYRRAKRICENYIQQVNQMIKSK